VIIRWAVGLIALGLWLLTVFHIVMLTVRYVGALRSGELRYTFWGAWAPGMPPKIKSHRKWAAIGAITFVALIGASFLSQLSQRGVEVITR
jgi:hypothetical protein